ncbi:hypothetical protein CPB86DRAFT_732734 [Serendipita vermifera]|nr:hypothetical protein CPB86DRAFT_732734 [Serendipita vermifera]
MADVAKPTKPAAHPLKRLLKKASRSKVSVSSAEPAVETETPTVEGGQNLERQTSIALTVPDERAEQAETEGQPQSPVVEEVSSPVSPTSGKRRISIVDKLKKLGNDRKDKKVSPVTNALSEPVDEANADLAAPTTENDQDVTDGVKPLDVAKRVRDLLTSSPPFYPTTLIASQRPNGAPSKGVGIEDALQGAQFLQLLSNQALMAGTSDQESVWSVLDRTAFSFKSNLHTASGDSLTTFDETQPDSSIMLCAPLFPDEDSKVELADYHLVKVPLDELDKQGLNAASWWPPWEWGKKPKPADPPTKTVRVWIPSTTKVSVQFAWWGFRIWLPEPVVKVLDDKSVEAVKRVAIISTALGWLVNHIPTAGLPLELQAVLTVAKAIVPIIGYIGGFISWYWSSVKGFDKGQGVVLSATWLLPIALIPGNWDYTPPTDSTPAEPSPSTPVPNPAPTEPSPSTPTPNPAPADPTTPIPNPNNPPSGTDPPIGTSPPPSLPSGTENNPVIVIPGPGGVYAVQS